MRNSKNYFLFLFVLFFLLISFELILRVSNYREIIYSNRLSFDLINSKKYVLSNNSEVIYELQPNFHESVESINSFGIRDKEYPFEKPNNTTRIILIGDSVLFGPYVKDEERFSEILEKKLNDVSRNTEVMNFGVGGYDINQEFGVFKRALNFEPDIIIIHTYTNDAARKIITRNKEIYELFEEYYFFYDSPFTEFLLRNSYVFRFFSHKSTLLLNLTNFIVYSPNFEMYKYKLMKMKEFSKEKNIPFFVVFHPYLEDNLTETMLNTEREYIRIFKDLNLTYLELRNNYSGHNFSNLRIRDTDLAHLNRQGHKVTADALYDFLLSQAKCEEFS